MAETRDLEKLLSIASSPLRSSAPEIPRLLIQRGERGLELYRMLTARNGFFAFEFALHVFPLGFGKGLDLETWNSASLWRSGYGAMAEDLLFFAEDAFGQQFAIRNGSIVSFNSEMGRVTDLAPDLEQWARRILDDYEFLTGHPLINEWQQQHGPIPMDSRLAPKTPFVVGGEFAVTNLYAAKSIELMRFRAVLAQQIKGLPDGTRIRLKITGVDLGNPP